MGSELTIRSKSTKSTARFTTLAAWLLCAVGAFVATGCTPTPIVLTTTGGDSQSTVINTPFSKPLSVNATGDTTPSGSGYQITFTAPALNGASGTFASTNTNTETVAADSSGNATSSTFTANGIVGSYSVTVTGPKGTDVGPPTPINFSLKNTPDLTVTVSPKPTSLATGQSLSFTATVQNDSGNGGVTWSVSGTGCSGAACGTISPSSSASGVAVVYKAPATIPSPPSVTVTAISVDKNAQGKLVLDSATFNITATAPVPSVSVLPTTLSAQAGATQSKNVTATVTNDPSNAGVTWALSGTGCSGATCGVISATSSLSGVPISYTPPAAVPSPATVTLTATTVATPTATATTTITVTPTVTVSISSSSNTVAAGSTLSNITATVQNDAANAGVTWSVSGASCGTACGSISPTASASGSAVVFTAPLSVSSPEVVTLTATSVTNTSVSATFNVTVTPAVASSQLPRYLFELNGDNTISTYGVVASTGQLRALSYFATGQTGPSVASVALHPSGKVIYTVQPVSISQDLITYSVSSGGLVSQLSSAAITGATYGQLLVDPLARFLWIVNGSGGQIIVAPLDPSTGAVGTLTVAASLANVISLATDPSGSHLFAQDNSGSITSFSISSAGALTVIGTPPASHPFSTGVMRVDPSGKFLYVLDESSFDSIFAYTISSSGLTPITGSPFLIPNNFGVDTDIVIDPSSSFLYALDFSSPTQPVDAFTIASNGALTTLTETVQYPGNVTASKISMDPTGKFLFLSFAPNLNEIWTYAIAQSGTGKGTLSPVHRIRKRAISSAAQLLSTGTNALTFTPQSLYVSNSGNDTVAQFSINASSGSLTSLGTPLAAGNQPAGVVADFLNRYVYATNNGSANISAYTVGSTGALTAISSSPFTTGSGPEALAVEPSGRFLYNANFTDNTVAGFAIGQGTGVLSSIGAVSSTDLGPTGVTVDPTGQFLYTSNATTGSVDAFQISALTGLLTAPSGGKLSAGTLTNASVIDPSGRFLFAAAPHSNSIYETLISSTTGVLTVNTNPFLPVGVSSTDPGAISAVVEPTGKFLYVASKGMNQIYAFTIDPSTGLLTSIITTKTNGEAADTGTTPVALAIDISGKYLYCVNSGSSDINIFSISLADGSLTPVGSATVPAGGSAPTGIVATGTVQ